MSAKDEIRNQIINALSGAQFPIATPKALLEAFPHGADTKCKSGEIEMTAGEAGTLLNSDNFPFISAEQVADTILDRAGL
jgi:hypothetical protein